MGHTHYTDGGESSNNKPYKGSPLFFGRVSSVGLYSARQFHSRVSFLILISVRI